jgi:hypothetical protein
MAVEVEKHDRRSAETPARIPATTVRQLALS